MSRPEQPIPHGTAAGYRGHQRRGEKPCPECRTAWRGYISKYRAKKGRR